MPRIVIQADQSDRYSAVVTLSERIISAHLQDCHYADRGPRVSGDVLGTSGRDLTREVEPLARSRGIAKEYVR